MNNTKKDWQVIYNVPVVAQFNDEGENEKVVARIETNITDARLIAAAPDMYEALKKLTNDFPDFNKIFPDTYTAINKALARAEGK